MSSKNRHGLSRHIPESIKREVRLRSKFGCVICRSGFYQYEHIDPVFSEATVHDPAKICCLCAGCHDSVTRGRSSKSYVLHAYERVQSISFADAGRPVGPLDFHTGTADVVIGGLEYSPGVNVILRYMGHDLIKVRPAETEGEPGEISAIFYDSDGRVSMELVKNEWVGSFASWDISSVGQRLIVKRTENEVALALRLDPPGRIVVEHLDMRLPDAHILAAEGVYAVARYLKDGRLAWVFADVEIPFSNRGGVAIELASDEELYRRVRAIGISEPDSQGVVISADGVVFPMQGISIASHCGELFLRKLAAGACTLSVLREAVFSGGSFDSLRSACGS